MSAITKVLEKTVRQPRDSGQVRARELSNGVTDPELRRILQHESAFELFSAIDSEVFLAPGSERPLALVVASARAREGRSTVAALYAGLSAAYSEDSKVLLIDTDVRSNALLPRFGASADQPGLYEYLRGDADLAHCLREGPVSNLTLLGGCGIADGRNKLGYQEFSDCMAEFRKRYDFIVLDSRPAADNPDLRAIAKAAGSALVVVEFGVTYRQQARPLVDSLLEVDCRILGAVFNKRIYHVPRLFYGR